jgi:multicomponent Na+:H+ antiporter subunit C
MSVLLAGVAATLFGVGTYLVLQRQLSRIVIGVGLMGHGANVLFVISAGEPGRPAFTGGEGGPYTDPLPQALALTGIVITFAVTAFLLALAYRSWVVTHDDEVEDAIEDRLVGRQRPDADVGGPLSDMDPSGTGLADTDVLADAPGRNATGRRATGRSATGGTGRPAGEGERP